MIKLDTWIISDTHFRHKNIVRYCNRPANHDEIMTKAWQDLVKPADMILHLGDVATWYGDTEGAANILSSIPGQKYLILGNHDKLGTSWYTALGFTIISPFVQKVSDFKVLFSHYPETEKLNWDINIHGHIHNNGYPPNASPKKDYRNVSVEVMSYQPVRLSDILYHGKYANHATVGFDKSKIRKRRLLDAED
jgi:calcineurin-like phosphoesterase family protein